jgi:hypothetical protein
MCIRDRYLNQCVDSEVASLYSFFNEGKWFYFYQIGNSKIHYLVYKKYEVEVVSGVKTEILYNNRYQYQLAIDMPCSVSTESLSYSLKPLLTYFTNYIEKNNASYKIYGKWSKGKFSVQLAVNYNRTSLYIDDSKLQTRGFEFGMHNILSYGIGLEYLLPYNRNKWGLFAEGSILKFSSTIYDPILDQTSTAYYKFLEFPLGLMYNSNLSSGFKLFIKVGAVPNFVLSDSKVSFYRPENQYELRSSTNAFFGAGISYNRISAEVRTYSTRNITKHLHKQGSEFSQASVRIAYSLVKLK